jgi:UDPglucose 6-dehydrogenase
VAYAHRSDELIVRDPKLENSAPLHKLNECDGIYICVPSPSLEDGHCDTSILEGVLKELTFANIAKDKVLISKVTAPPSTYSTLLAQYPNLVYCPEFLTAANNTTDYLNASYFIFGGHREWCERARNIVRSAVPLVDDKLLITDIRSASLFKYMMNSYLATKVTFMNDMKDLADRYNIDWDQFKTLAVWDDRIGYTHMSVPGPDGQKGWGGACFPKDVAAIIMDGIDHGADMELLQRVEEINRKQRSQ